MKRLSCFSKRDFGGIIFFSIAAAEIILAVMLLFSGTINRAMLMTGLEIGSIVLGIGYVMGYYANARSRFRPCWYLPIGFLLAFIGITAIVIGFLNLAGPGFGLVTLSAGIAVLNFVMCAAVSIQLKALCLMRWIPIMFFAFLNAGYVAIVYFDLWAIRSKPAVCVAVYCILLAIQTVSETFYNLNIETNE